MAFSVFGNMIIIKERCKSSPMVDLTVVSLVHLLIKAQALKLLKELKLFSTSTALHKEETKLKCLLKVMPRLLRLKSIASSQTTNFQLLKSDYQYQMVVSLRRLAHVLSIWIFP